ncbi:hypothetical protein EAI30_10280 [Romboutsia ilealis]|uniref:Uncharacterized protein n=1 Tax=Romboutsia faecis TaxID=2764597 RepID=A0ABR7JN55_9FIRM|nr:hypothetical protein [Romboutsia faecis]MBC5996356.1 hypothetical protein [Romboutsia faecis]MRN25003.1 hypothetical protein [Romboutsia ilealis]
MNLFIIQININKNNKNYNKLLQTIKNSGQWYKYSDCSYLLKSTLSIEILTYAISKYVNIHKDASIHPFENNNSINLENFKFENGVY